MGLRFPPFIGYLLRRRRRARGDFQVADELAWDDKLDLPENLEIEWLGTSGFRLACEGTTILIDPYVSRVSLADVALRRRITPDLRRIAALALDADAILIGHAHFDHVMDAPVIAATTGATVYGSQSSAHLMSLHDLDEQAVVVEPYDVYEIGPFKVSFVPSVHSKLVLGLRVAYGGELTCEHLDDLTAPAYKCGDVFAIHIEVAGRTFYHQGSADLIDDAIRPEHKGVDYFLAGIAGRGYTRRYLPRVLGALEPRIVVPNHFDNFFLPLEAPMAMSFNVNLAAFPDEVGAVSREFEVAVPRRVAAQPTLSAGAAASEISS